MTYSAGRALWNSRISRRLLVAAGLSLPLVAHAQVWPDRPLRVIVPGAPGGTVDIAARTIGDDMERELGQPWRVDPRPGANGVIAARAFLDAPSDHHTLYLTVLSHLALPFLSKVPFDVIADFQPVAMIGTIPVLLCVPAASPANTVAGFVAYARANPGRLNYLNPGNGTVSHLMPEMLKIKYGLDVASVYYKAITVGIADLAAGRLAVGLVATGLALPYLQDGRLKAIAQVSRRRMDALAGVRTLAEQGVHDLAMDGLVQLYARTTMPAAKVARINEAVGLALAIPATRTRLAAAHIEPMPMPPSEVGAILRREHDRLGRMIRQVGITADSS